MATHWLAWAVPGVQTPGRRWHGCRWGCPPWLSHWHTLRRKQKRRRMREGQPHCVTSGQRKRREEKREKKEDEGRGLPSVAEAGVCDNWWWLRSPLDPSCCYCRCRWGAKYSPSPLTPLWAELLPTQIMGGGVPACLAACLSASKCEHARESSLNVCPREHFGVHVWGRVIQGGGAGSRAVGTVALPALWSSSAQADSPLRLHTGWVEGKSKKKKGGEGWVAAPSAG